MYNDERKLIVKLIRENVQLAESNREHCEDKVYLHQDINDYKMVIDGLYELKEESNEYRAMVNEYADTIREQDKRIIKLSQEKEESFELGKKCMKDFVIQECKEIINYINALNTVDYVIFGKRIAYEYIIKILEDKK
jgi:hypothetical protein